jgi:RNA polymerase sigma-B factor
VINPALFDDALAAASFSDPRNRSFPNRLREVVSERERLIVTYAYLCRRGARKFLRSGLERSDLEQVAAIGLIKATDRYDRRMHTPFEAFAWLMILGELMHHVRDHERLVRIPRRLHALERPYHATTESLAAALGRDPRDGEVADAMGILSTTVGELRRAREALQILRLDDLEAENGRNDPAFAAPQTELALEDRLLLEAALSSLSTLERRVVVGLYLLGMTQLEMARRLGISPKRVSRLHGAALAHLQRACGTAG